MCWSSLSSRHVKCWSNLRFEIFHFFQMKFTKSCLKVINRHQKTQKNACFRPKKAFFCIKWTKNDKFHKMTNFIRVLWFCGFWVKISQNFWFYHVSNKQLMKNDTHKWWSYLMYFKPNWNDCPQSVIYTTKVDIFTQNFIFLFNIAFCLRRPHTYINSYSMTYHYIPLTSPENRDLLIKLTHDYQIWPPKTLFSVSSPT